MSLPIVGCRRLLSLDVVVSIISLLEFGRVISVISGRLAVAQLNTDAHCDAAATHEVARHIDDDDNHDNDTDSDSDHCP